MDSWLSVWSLKTGKRNTCGKGAVGARAKRRLTAGSSRLAGLGSSQEKKIVNVPAVQQGSRTRQI